MASPPQKHPRSSSSPSSAFYSAAHFLSSSDFHAADTQSDYFAPSESTRLPRSYSGSVRPFVKRLPGVDNADGRDPNRDAVIVRHGSWGSDTDRDSSDQPSPIARARTCDVYLGYGSRSPMLLRLADWLRAELEMHGVSCFASDRRRCKDAPSHAAAREAIEMAAFGVVIVTVRSFLNPYSIEEMRVFSERKKLVPIFLGLSKGDCVARDIVERRGELWGRFGGELWREYGGVEQEWRMVADALSSTVLKLEVNVGNLRDRVLDAVELLGMRLGRSSVMESVARWRKLAADEFPYPRNPNFVGRKKELLDLETQLFGDVQGHEEAKGVDIRNNKASKELAGWLTIDGPQKEPLGKDKGKKPLGSKQCEDDSWIIERHHNISEKSHQRKSNVIDFPLSRGIACVCGDSGIGKTELLLEFAYQHSQRYKMVLWVGGEARYLRENYMKLLHRLGIDVSLEKERCLVKSRPRSFEDREREAIDSVRKELTRDIPFLLVVDNLESEKDWWDGRSIMEFLPQFGRATHVIISTRLRHVSGIKNKLLRLPYLSSAEAMSLMKGSSSNLRTEDDDVLRIIEERIGRVPLGLALIGAILSELPIQPLALLELMNNMPYREMAWSVKEDLVLKHNPFLIPLLDACFSLLDRPKNLQKLAIKAVEASYWFAPSPVPIYMLAYVVRWTSEENRPVLFWKGLGRMLSCMCMATTKADSLEIEAFSMLMRLRIARSSTRVGYISFHNIFKQYAHKRSNSEVAISVVQAISTEEFAPERSDHIWAACFMLFKFGTDPAVVDLSPRDLLSFIKRFVLPIASHSYTMFSLCNGVLELLRLATEELEELEDSLLSAANGGQNRSSSSRVTKSSLNIESNPLIYLDLAHLRAVLLERRAKLMLKGGQYDIAEQLCRTAISIKEVLYGWEHSETQYSHKLMEEIIRFQSKTTYSAIGKLHIR